jgi:hypothetical protein
MKTQRQPGSSQSQRKIRVDTKVDLHMSTSSRLRYISNSNEQLTAEIIDGTYNYVINFRKAKKYNNRKQFGSAT